MDTSAAAEKIHYLKIKAGDEENVKSKTGIKRNQAFTNSFQ